MTRRLARRRGSAALTAVTLIGLSACSAPSDAPLSRGDGALRASAATSAADLGGMAALVAAAKKEGELNVIALPPDWVNYGEIIKGFKARYGLTVNSASPGASSPAEITQAKALRGQSTAPDVFDLTGSVASANLAMFAPYRVATFNDVPAALKEPSGLMVSDYGGFMSIGYDAAAVPAPTTVADLLKPAYKGKVALNGNPTRTGSGFNGVVMTALSLGGTPDDISKGVSFFKALKAAGNFLPVDPTGATIESGQTPVVLDWDYLNVAQARILSGSTNWRTVVPPGALVGGYYVQAINKDAPHPAAARLWEEYLFSDEGQNLWVQGGARPVRESAMVAAGTIDKVAYAALPLASGTAVFLTKAQSDKANAYLMANWPEPCVERGSAPVPEVPRVRLRLRTWGNGRAGRRSHHHLLAGCVQARACGYAQSPGSSLEPARYAAPVRDLRGVVLADLRGVVLAAIQLTPRPDEESAPDGISPREAMVAAARALFADLGLEEPTPPQS